MNKIKLRKDPSYFAFECFICCNKIEGYFSYSEERCTHFYMLGNDMNTKRVAICLECGEPLFHKLKGGKVIHFDRVTKPIFLDANDMKLCND